MNNRYISAIKLISCIIIVAMASALSAKTANVPEPFRGQDKDSKISINYDDFSQLLKLTVLDMGKSTRAKAPATKAKIGSRMKSKRQSIYTAIEGNRFLFDNFRDDDNKAVITRIRQSLEKVPDEVAMSDLNAREQLAYWLNLYNISLIEQLVAIYPKKDIEDELYGKNGIMQNKFLTVSGIKLSLDDIHKQIILGKYQANPIVIYGLFQGIIGGPNIRTTAYTGESVIKQLRHNADNFINSNRGTYKGKKNTLRVSTFYDRNREFFPDFNKSIKKHLAYYLDSNYRDYIDDTKKFKTNIEANGIVDLMGGQRQISSSAATNQAAFLGSAAASGMNSDMIAGCSEGGCSGFSDPSTGIKSEAYRSLAVDFGRYSPQEMELLLALKRERKGKTGKVLISEDEDKAQN